jgi:ribosomal protein S18 acetylase RimI-like enzyme
MDGSHPAIEVRRAEPHDVVDLADVHVTAWHDTYRGLIPDRVIDRLDVAARVRQWERTIVDPDIAAWIATVDGTPAGLMSVGPSSTDGVGEVLTIYVTAAFWDLGVGSRLWHAGIDDLRSRGFRSAGLWVLDTNARAREFYRRKGWSATGGTRTDDAFGDPIDEVRYASPAWG